MKNNKGITIIRKGEIDFYYPLKISSKLSFKKTCQIIEKSISKTFKDFDEIYSNYMNEILQKGIDNFDFDEDLSIKITYAEKKKRKKKINKHIPENFAIADSKATIEPTENGVNFFFVSGVDEQIEYQNQLLSNEEQLSRKYYGNFYCNSQTRFLLPPFRVKLENGVETWITSILYVFRNGMGFLRISLPLINVSISPMELADYDRYISEVMNVCGVETFKDSIDNHINAIKKAYLHKLGKINKVNFIFQNGELNHIILADYDSRPSDINIMSQDIQEDIFKIVAAPMPEEVGYSYREEALSYIKNNSFGNHKIKYITSSIGRCLSIVDDNSVKDIINNYKTSNDINDLQEEHFAEIFDSIIVSARSNVEFALLVLMLKRINNSYMFMQKIQGTRQYYKVQKEYNSNIIFIAEMQDGCIYASAKEQLTKFEKMMPYFLNADITAEKLEAIDKIILQDKAKKSSLLQNFLSIGSLILTGVFGLPAIQETLTILRDYFINQDLPIVTIENCSIMLWLTLLSVIFIFVVGFSHNK